LNNLKYTTLTCEAGSFTAFSGDGPDRNNPDATADLDRGPIPLGRYFILDRQSGGFLGPIKDYFLNRDKWFALYRDDDDIDDQTYVDSVKRGLFRMHPLGPRRMSTGCIVLQYTSEFERLRSYILRSAVEYIPGTGIRTYGTVTVGREAPATLDPKFRRGGGLTTGLA
jgi:hypothetical protein